MDEKENPSQVEVNKMVRVLNGTKLKFTCRLVLASGAIFEFQSQFVPVIKYLEEDRSSWIMGKIAEYETYPMMRLQDGAILFVEENPA